MENLGALFTSGLQGWVLILFFILMLFGRDIVDAIKWLMNKMGASKIQSVSMKLDNESQKISDLQNKTVDIDFKMERLKEDMENISQNLLGTENVNELIKQSSEYAIETAYKRSLDNRMLSDKKIEEAIEKSLNFTKENRMLSDSKIEEVSKEIKITVKSLTEWGLQIAKQYSEESKNTALAYRKQSKEEIEEMKKMYANLATSQEGTQLMVIMNLYMSRKKISPSELLRLESVMKEYIKVGGNHHCENLYDEFRTMINDGDIKVLKEKTIK
jgi:phosphoribosyl-ATP pyrophosphohydrolase